MAGLLNKFISLSKLIVRMYCETSPANAARHNIIPETCPAILDNSFGCGCAALYWRSTVHGQSASVEADLQ